MRATRCVIALLLLTAACGKGDKPVPPPAPPASSVPPPSGADRARAAALVANAIAANPAAADSILKAAGYTPDGFQRLMYEIAADSAMAAAYAAAKAR